VRTGSRKGHIHAWGRPLRGYSKKDETRGVRPLDVERMRRMRAEGKSTRKISEALKGPRSTVRRALARAV
jgi:DNA invertase Pin-like site-specific DNA recombinase